MHRSFLQLTVKLIFSLVLLGMLAACAATPSQKKEGIEVRIQARWDGLISGDYASAWEYYSPGFRSANSAVDLEIYWRSRQVETLDATYKSHECTDTLCDVMVDMTYKVMKPVRGLDEWKNNKVIKEKWILTENEWWFVQE